ncbi:MAG: Nitrogen-fixing NifU domain protein [Parcubacteria group bacterium GW2011_GWA2_47_10]|nr:MAG: Nitrogen-fixing NifU domain protein [Parcubacteria group bacterium GW2011_GWA2_47_10]
MTEDTNAAVPLKPKIDTNADVVNQYTGEKWYYTDIVKEHFFNPKNLMLDEPNETDYDATGMVGSPACGDMMKMWLKIDKGTEHVKEMKWRTFGCGSAIAATSMYSVMITENGGLPIDEALKIKPQHIMERLGGLPNRKIHCSVLADKAFRKAANDYFHRSEQHARVTVEGAKVIDPKLNITDKDIEEAVLEGAMDLEGVQKKLKVGVGSPEIITEVEQLIRFYKEKYYG